MRYQPSQIQQQPFRKHENAMRKEEKQPNRVEVAPCETAELLASSELRMYPKSRSCFCEPAWNAMIEDEAELPVSLRDCKNANNEIDSTRYLACEPQQRHQSTLQESWQRPCWAREQEVPGTQTRTERAGHLVAIVN